MDCVISISFSKSAIIDYINFLITNLSTLISPSGSPHHHFYQILHFFFFKTFLYGLRLTFTITVIYSLPIPPFTSHPYQPPKGKLQKASLQCRPFPRRTCPPMLALAHPGVAEPPGGAPVEALVADVHVREGPAVLLTPAVPLHEADARALGPAERGES